MKPSRFRHRRAGAAPGAATSPGALRRTGTGGANANAEATPIAVSLGPVPNASRSGDASAWTGPEEQWLERARTAWQVGDWPLLAALGHRPLQRHGDRARLALLAASGHFQLGDQVSARRLIGQALGWGCDKRLVGRILVSGLHNTLGRAASLLDQPAQALTQFTAAILTASPAGAVRKATQARAGEQLAQLGLSVAGGDGLLIDRPSMRATRTAPSAMATLTTPASRLAAERWLSIGRPAKDPAAGAAAADAQVQCFVFPVGEGRVRFVLRSRGGGEAMVREFGWGLGDGLPSLAIDVHGHVRVSYVDEDGNVRSRRSLAPHAVERWSPVDPSATVASPLRPGGHSLPLTRAGGHWWWSDADRGGARTMTELELADSARVLAADGASSSGRRRLTLLIAEPPRHADGGWKLSIADFAA